MDMMNDDEFHLKLFVFNIVVILVLVLILLVLPHHPSGVVNGPWLNDSAILSDELIILWLSVSTMRKVCLLSSDVDAVS